MHWIGGQWLDSGAHRESINPATGKGIAPIALGIRSLAPALAAGCTAAVILPNETAQVNALISEVISDADGLPPGVVNIA